MATHLAFPVAQLPAHNVPFIADPETHRLRQEIQILDDKVQTATLIERFDLEAKRHAMEWEYEAAVEATNPEQVWSPQLIFQDDLDHGFCTHCHQSLR